MKNNLKKAIKKISPKTLINVYTYFIKWGKEKKRLRPYKGKNVKCPICNSKFSEFGIFGVVPRKNALCYKCGSLERHRLLWFYLNKKTDLLSKKNKKIKLLHFAPENFFYDIFSNIQDIEYYPCDISPDIYNYKGKVKVKKVDITNIPFKEKYFDVIICNHVLEHIPNDLLAMTELYRVINNRGWAILQVPIDYNREITYEDFSITLPQERKQVFGQNDHVRIYGRDYMDRLKKSGFIVTEDDFINSFSAKEISRYGLMESELIYYCQKA